MGRWPQKQNRLWWPTLKLMKMMKQIKRTKHCTVILLVWLCCVVIFPSQNWWKDITLVNMLFGWMLVLSSCNHSVTDSILLWNSVNPSLIFFMDVWFLSQREYLDLYYTELYHLLIMWEGLRRLIWEGWDRNLWEGRRRNGDSDSDTKEVVLTEFQHAFYVSISS